MRLRLIPYEMACQHASDFALSYNLKGIVSRDGVSTETTDVYSSLGLNIASRICFTLVKSRVKNI
jgi:hypothetical protein